MKDRYAPVVPSRVDLPGRDRRDALTLERVVMPHHFTHRSATRRGGRKAVANRGLRRGLPLESLEDRALPSLAFQFADGIGVSGTGAVDIALNAVANDAAGNVYVTGSLQGTADFDPGSGTTNLSSTGDRDTVVAKYAPSGALIWAKDLRGGSASAVGQGSAVAVDSAGNVYLTGTFSGTVNFNPGAGNTSLSAPGRNDVFIEKLDANGNFLWAEDVAGTTGADDEGYAIAVDSSGNVFAAGSFQATATFGTQALTAGGSFDNFITKLNSAGSFLWAKATNGSGNSSAQTTGLAVDGSGNVLAAGFFAGTVDFDPGPNVLDLTSTSARGAFVTKLDPSGNLLWADAFVGSDIAEGNAVAVDPSGQIYTTGFFAGTAAFGAGSNAVTLTASGYEDPFIAKLTSAGQVVWADELASTGSSLAQGTGLGIDGSGHVVVAGWFYSTVDFNPLSATATMTSAGSADVFVAEYDGSGNYIASLQAGGANFDVAFGASVNASGSVAIAGTYTGPATFGGGSLPAIGSQSVFIAQVSVPQVAQTIPAPSSPVLEAASDTGLSQSDDITAAKSPVFDVNQAVATDTVQLLRDGVVVATRTGPGALTDPGPVPDGTHAYTAIQIDPTNLKSAPSSATQVTIDTTAPAAPAAPALSAADDSGLVGDGITNVRQPHLIGTTVPGVLVSILNASGNSVGTAMSAANGGYSIQVANPLNDGTYAFRARVEDVAGNLSVPGAALSITIDTTAPAAPSTPNLLPADDSGVKGDLTTNVRQPHLIGTAVAGTTVQIVTSGGSVLGTTTAAAGGSYSVAFASPLSDGIYPIRVSAVDVAGNVSVASAAINLTILTVAPAAPSTPTLLPADDTGVLGDGITTVAQPHLIGTATAGITVQLIDPNGNVLGTGTAGSNGSYSVQVSAALSVGSYSIRAEAVDYVGNVSAPSAAFGLTISAVTLSVPSVPTLLPADDSGVLGDGITNVRQPHLIGTSVAGATIQIVSANGTVMGAATVASNGTYSVAFATPLSDGVYPVSVSATMGAGIVSPLSAAFTLTIDATPPPAPAAPVLLAADDTGIVGDGITVVRQPRLTGTTIPGGVVSLLDGSGNVLATTTAGPNGSFTIKPASPLGLGTISLRDRVTDVAGNQGPAGPAISLKIIESTPGDFNGDGIADVGIFRPSTAQWFVSLSGAGGAYAPVFGATNLFDIPVPADYDGVGHAELAVFRPSTGQWLIAGPTGVRVVSFGATNLFDIPVPGDYDGVGHAELAVFRPSTGQWLIAGPTGLRIFPFGATNLYDFPLEGPTAALKKLGVVGGIRVASLSVPTVSAQAVEASPPPASAQPATIAVTPLKPTRPKTTVSHPRGPLGSPKAIAKIVAGRKA